jgi:hypothetical protein
MCIHGYMHTGVHWQCGTASTDTAVLFFTLGRPRLGYECMEFYFRNLYTLRRGARALQLELYTQCASADSSLSLVHLTMTKSLHEDEATE